MGTTVNLNMTKVIVLGRVGLSQQFITSTACSNFDCKIAPNLFYGAEIEGIYLDVNENVPTVYFERFLGVGKYASNCCSAWVL